MEKLNNLKRLYVKLQRELQQYEEELKKLPVEEIIKKSYETTCKEEFAEMFNTEYKYDNREIIALLNIENTLEYLYQDWFKSDGGIHKELEYSIEYSIEKAMSEQFKNNNPKLIQTISKLLQELNNYDKCYGLKSRYNIVNFDEKDIYHILNLQSAHILNAFFKDIKEDEHIQYLVEIQVFNSELYDDIERRILPKFEEFINGESKQQQKKEREQER